jgi:hypothetical protein
MVPEALRQMLVQRSTAGHVHDLHPSADPQQRDPALHRPDRERHLEPVADRIRPDGLGVGLDALDCGVDVRPSAEDQRVDPVEQRVRGLGRGRVGGQQGRHPAGPLDRVRVGERQQHGRLKRPDAEARLLDRSTDSDQGTGHVRKLAGRQPGDMLALGDQHA